MNASLFNRPRNYKNTMNRLRSTKAFPRVHQHLKTHPTRRTMPLMMSRKSRLCVGEILTFLEKTSLFPKDCFKLAYLILPFDWQCSYDALFKEMDATPGAGLVLSRIGGLCRTL